MPTGYTRQSAAEIVTGQTVNASSFNNEFNAIQAAMDATTGHTHDGTVGGGAQISLATSVQGTLGVANGGTGATTAANARTNLGLGSIATQSAASVAITGGTIAGITDLAIGDGGTGASDAATARTNLGLGSIATQNAAAVSIGTLTTTGDVTVADRIHHAGDTDTAIRFPTNDVVSIETAGVESVRFTATGIARNVATPTSAIHVVDTVSAAGGNGFKFADISDTTRNIELARSGGSYSYNGITGAVGVFYSSNSLALMADTTGGNNSILFSVGGAIRAQLQWDGKFGIGTTSPATTLDVNGDVTITDKIIHSGDTDTSIRFPAVDTVTVETGGVERMRVASTETVFTDGASSSITLRATTAIDTANREIGAIQFQEPEGTGDGTLAIEAAIKGLRGDTDSFNSSGVLAFFTRPFNGALTERLRITPSGAVGIGTAAPSEQLHITGNFRIGSAVQATPTGSAPLFAARAWVNFNGTGTVAIRASGNVTSITDNNTGDYTVNFTTAMPDANYSTVTASQWQSGAATNTTLSVSATNAPTSAAVRLINFNGNTGALSDPSYANVAIFR